MHLIACVWYMIGNADDGWVPSVFPLGTETVVERYFQSMSTVALGSFIEETKPNEEVFAIFSVLFNGFVRALKPNLFRVCHQITDSFCVRPVRVAFQGACAKLCRCTRHGYHRRLALLRVAS